MPKIYPTEVVQPLGSHNKPYPCVKTEHVKEYLDLPFEYLNPVQSDFVQHLEDDETNIVVASATSSGKTLIAELFAARSLKQGKGIIYIAPMKALTDEKEGDWTNPKHSFSKLKIEVLTGDFVLTEKKKEQLNEAEIILMTPEMLNSKCRKFGSNEWLSNKDLIVDETHLVALENRGDSLEVAIVQFYENAQKTRALFISATLPNVQDFGKWLKVLSGRETIILKSDYRPCKLNTIFSTFAATGAYEKKEEQRILKVLDIIEENGTAPTIVFVGNKKFGHKLCGFLTLRGIKHYFHNADLDRETRNKIEREFKNGDFKVLVATTSVAWGCFSGDTSVLNANKQFEKISEIKDTVVSIDIENKTTKNAGFIRKIVTQNESHMKKIVLRNGLSVVCTEDHLFPLSNGIEKQAKDIIEEDELITYDKEEFSKVKVKRVTDEPDVDIVYDLSIQGSDPYYVVNGIVTHNCNFPAQIVIQSHTSFGLTPMHPSNILQSIGRAGRTGWGSDSGTAYIICEKNKIESERARIFDQYLISSTLNDNKTLIFHILSYVVDGIIQTPEDLFKWYGKTLASTQGNHINLKQAQDVMESLRAKLMISLKDGKYAVTKVGIITASMYMCPYDIYDWLLNFSKIEILNPDSSLPHNEQRKINLKVASALAECYNWGRTRAKNPTTGEIMKVSVPSCYITESEKNCREIKEVASELHIVDVTQHPYIKYTGLFYALLNGDVDSLSPELIPHFFNISRDVQRIASTLRQCDDRFGKGLKQKGTWKGFGWGSQWDLLSKRLRYGVKIELVDLMVDGIIGRVRAEKLFKAGIKTKEHIMNPSNHALGAKLIGDKLFKDARRYCIENPD